MCRCERGQIVSTSGSLAAMLDFRKGSTSGDVGSSATVAVDPENVVVTCNRWNIDDICRSLGENCRFCACALKYGERNKETLSNRQNFSTHRKSMSLRTMVTTHFRSKVQKLCRFCACTKKKANTAESGSRSSKYSTSTNGAKKYKIAEIVQALCKQLT